MRRLPVGLRRLLPGIAAALLLLGAAACGGGSPGNGLPDPTPTLRPYTPPSEEEFFDSDVISDLTLEDVIALLGDPRSASSTGYRDRLPVLVVEPQSASFTLAGGGTITQALSVTLEATGSFEWDFQPPDGVPWLSVTRPQNQEEGDFDQLVLHLDATGLSPGRYDASVTIFGVPVARDSPQVIPVMLTVEAP